MPMSCRLVATGMARPITMASNARTSAQMVRTAEFPSSVRRLLFPGPAQQMHGVTGGDHRTGDQHPHTTELSVYFGQDHGLVDGVVEWRGGVDAVLTEDLLCQVRQPRGFQ